MKLNKKQIKRDSIDLKLMELIIKNLGNKTFTEKRAIICIVLLFITGCRINELRNFNKYNINKLLQYGTLTIYTFKTRNTRRIDIGKLETRMLKDIMPVIEEYYKELSPRNHILYSSKGKEINNRSAYIWLNKILKRLGKMYGVDLLTHSFRIGYVTKLLKKYNVQIAKSIIGHNDITTTIKYDRNLLNSKDVKDLLDKLNKEN